MIVVIFVAKCLLIFLGIYGLVGVIRTIIEDK